MEGAGQDAIVPEGHGSKEDDSVPGMSPPDGRNQCVQPMRMPNECKSTRPRKLLCYQAARPEKMEQRKPVFNPLFRFSIANIDIEKKEVYCFKYNKFHKPQPQIIFYLNLN